MARPATYTVAQDRSRRLALFTETNAPQCASEERAPYGPFELSATIDLPPARTT
ncbi:MAG: hypothetical protein O7D28_01960 [Actinobacteria bacterium]|nr:hypothetical protein [Actinomycetota bacterium]